MSQYRSWSWSRSWSKSWSSYWPKSCLGSGLSLGNDLGPSKLLSLVPNSLYTKCHNSCFGTFRDSYMMTLNIRVYEDDIILALLISEIDIKNLRFVFMSPYFFKSLHLVVWLRWACIQHFVFKALKVFEIAMKMTWNLCFRRWTSTSYFIMNLLYGVIWVCIQNFIIWDGYEEDIDIVFWKTT